MSQQIEIYQTEDGATQVEVRFEQDSIWLNQKQISELFNTTPQNITLHLKNIYKEEELQEEATCKRYLQVQKEGKREVKRKQLFYNLDAIISIGYRINSKRGTQFRIWATQRLKDYLVQGYAINEKRLHEKEQEIRHLKSGISILNRAVQQKSESSEMEWLEVFANGLSLLDDYDHESLDKQGQSKQKASYPMLSEYEELVEVMKHDFDSAVFGKEKDDNFKSSVAQIKKGIGERDFYPSLEEKASMLLYLITKNHSFVDGNKRIAAACFLLFLNRNGMLFNSDERPIISNEALASLTLFIASSKPEEMETVKRLVISVLNRNRA